MRENSYIDSKTLASGKVLLYLKQKFLENRTEQALFALLGCLRDSQVVVPVNVTMSEEDKEMFLNAKKGDQLSTNDEMRLKPDILQNGDKFFFPMFSNEEEMPEKYAANFSGINMSVLQCIEMAKFYEQVTALVLDAFTDPMILEYPLADLIPDIESRLKPEKNKERNK